ncbi:MAG: phenylalanine--tRNA ligase subunit beta [Patescibacteria group bacterium]
MYLSLQWLKEFVNIPKSISPEELGLRLTMHTVEIDSVQKQADKYKNIVIGKILETKQHPQADRLQLVKVDVGKEKLSIVCGAFNIKIGQKVPVALAGAILPNGLEISKREVRGEISNGMLCAEDELALGPDHSGIFILDKKAKIGQAFGKYLNLEDVIFEVDNKSITHRPDLWNHYGMAREIAAFLGLGLKDYNPSVSGANITKNEMQISVKVEDFSLCPRYMAVAIDGIKIEDSPKWLQVRLSAVGMRPINNIVDITNYVMLEMGQPLHAFDSTLFSANNNKNGGHKIIIRQARNNEILETLDGQKRKLDKEMLVIANSKNSVALAGIMGGANSEVSAKTTSIILESANFNSLSIRKTAQKFNLRTEASMRFEKNLDPSLSEIAVNRTIELIKKICPETKVESLIADEKKFKINQGPIELNLAWLNKIVGEEIDEKKINDILTRLGFKVAKKKEKVMSVKVPSWRATGDITLAEDLVEEIVRIYGYNNLKFQMPKIIMDTPQISEERKIERKIKEFLSQGGGLTEVFNYSFVGEDQLKKLGVKKVNNIKLANPIASHLNLLKKSLVPNLLENVKLNQPRYDEISLFEIGNIFLNESGELKKDNISNIKLPRQEKVLGIVIAEENNSFSKIKGVVEYLLNNFNLNGQYLPATTYPSWMNKECTASIKVNNQEIGYAGVLDEEVAAQVGLKKKVALAEINLSSFYKALSSKNHSTYQEIFKYPPIVRDLAFVVEDKILYNDIREEIINFSKLIKKLELFDVFSGGKLGESKKNLAFHIIYQAEDKTLTAEEIDKLQTELIKKLEKKFKAQIRNF